MHPAIRYQGDLEPMDVVVAMRGDEEGARQEFKDEADTEFQLRRFGAGQAFRLPQSGMQDFDLGLQEAIAALKASEESFARLTVEQRQRYRSWDEIAFAIYAGNYQPPEAAAGGSAGDSGGSARAEPAPA